MMESGRGNTSKEEENTELYRITIMREHPQKRERGWEGMTKPSNWGRNIETIVGNWIRYKKGKDDIKRKEMGFILVPP